MGACPCRGVGEADRLGGEVGGTGDGQTCKVANQIVVALNVQAVAEAFKLASACGVDKARVREALLGGFAASRVLELHGQRMIDDNYAPGFKARLHNKDMGIVNTTAAALETSLPATREVSTLIARLNRAKLLIIDDLGAERSTDFALEKVYDIVDSRYRAKLPIILTTNLSMTEMKESADIRYTRIYDRIFEMCYPMQFTGRSWRKAEAARRFDEMKNFLEGNDG